LTQIFHPSFVLHKMLLSVIKRGTVAWKSVEANIILFCLSS
jgi:hypothetical protein